MPELYRLADQTHVNTQAEAKHSGQPWEKIEVPTKRHELLAYLNEIVSSVRGGISSDTPPAADPQEPVPSREEQLDQGYDLSGEPPAPAPPPPPPPAPPKITARIVEDFILDEATTSQIENLFAAIGARFHEMRKRARDATVDD